MDSSSEDEARGNGRYAPVLADKIATVSSGRVPNTAAPTGRQASAGTWFKEGVSLYNNDLFTDGGGDVLGGGAGADPHDANRPLSPQAPAGTPSAKKSLAAKRQERLAAGTYEPNSLLKSPSARAPGLGPPPTLQPSASGDYGYGGAGQRGSNTMSNMGPARGSGDVGTSGAAALRGLGGVYDPNPQPAPQEDMGYQAPGTYGQQGGQQQQQGFGIGSMARSGSNPGVGMQRSLPPPQPAIAEISDLETFLHSPGPKNGPILCRIERVKGSTSKTYPKYMLFLEDGMRFMMSARKRKNQTTSNYVMSLDQDDISRESDTFFGKVRANFVGTEFTLYDNGAKPGDKGKVRGQPPRQELACVTYQYNVLGTRGPRKMTACIPAIDNQARSYYRPKSEDDTLLERVKNNRGLEELVLMRNKPPRWNEELEAYCLNFNGRVTEASVKNFQLVTDDNHNHVILQFGKVGKDVFTMDYQWPISVFQAFALCISSFDNKLGCE